MAETIIILLIVALDRAGKILAAAFLKQRVSYILIDGFFRLYYTENTGASFGIFSGGTIFLTIFNIIILTLLFYFFIRQRKKNPSRRLFHISMAMIIGGAIGNLIDRLAFGYVVDFFDVYAVNFAIFNVADCFITVGAVIFCACLLFDKKIKL
jgi:signal peptidase II